MAEPQIELVQFLASHFNEKARWALDWKGLPHTRRSLLPGPHIPVVRRLSGQTATPVLLIDERVVAGSADILAALEELRPEPPLFPSDPEARAEVEALQAHFDEEVGPQVRTALFSVLLDEPGYLCAIFDRERPGWQRALYRAVFPLVSGLVRKGNGVTGPEAVEAAFAATERALDLVARRSGGTGYLVGDGFTAADLAAAALLAPTLSLDHPDMARPEPLPERVRAWLARWEKHPASAWVRETYRRHRPPRAPAAAR